MSKEKQKQKQIDEIAECVIGGTIDYRLQVAELVYNKGYRKQSAVIDEFVQRLKEEMKNLARMVYKDTPYYLVGNSLIDRIAEEMKGGAE